MKKYTIRKYIFNKENRNKPCYINVNHVDAFVCIKFTISCYSSKTNKTELKQQLYLLTPISQIQDI